MLNSRPLKVSLTIKVQLFCCQWIPKTMIFIHHWPPPPPPLTYILHIISEQLQRQQKHNDRGEHHSPAPNATAFSSAEPVHPHPVHATNLSRHHLPAWAAHQDPQTTELPAVWCELLQWLKNPPKSRTCENLLPIQTGASAMSCELALTMAPWQGQPIV